jgi:hypothetical protein
MAKHLGSRRQPALRTVPRGVAWGAIALAGVVTVTVMAVAHGMTSHDPAELVGASSHDTTQNAGDRTSTSSDRGVPDTGRRVDVSRQQDRPRPRRSGSSTARS